MPQPSRKRRRLDDTTRQEVSDLMSQMLQTMVPNIVEMVMQKLKGEMSQPQTEQGPTSVSSVDGHQTINVEATVNQEESTQQSSSTVEVLSSQPLTTSAQGNTLNTTGPLHSGRPLVQSVDKKLKAKIWAEEYVQLGALLFKNPYSKLEAVQGENNEITFQHKEQKFYIKSITQWINAFHIFVSIYCEKFPNQSSNMMKYMAIVQKLNADVGEKAALHYDEQFRLWRADNPTLMPWQQINQELNAEALQLGLKTKIQTLEKSSKSNNSYF
ncbi:uncharacterized protein LOC134254853 [Saccostrea cucullata]|uniref:uncharacterized protein LOC134254853 n=1 Tax=Saccostrea cuccullata TaxID=36930 RepID=UPI002ED157D0